MRSLKLRPSSLALLIMALVLLSLGSSGPVRHESPARQLPILAKLGYGAVPFQPGGSVVPYDEQVGMSFTRSFARLDFNVTAIEQTAPDSVGAGPGYLLNGLTSTGYWYQVGLSWKWPSPDGSTLPGFSMNYEVFGPYANACERSIYPANCAGGGVENITVASGDLVLLSLSFSNGNVTMRAMDWNTGSSATQTYFAEGETQFIGLSSNLAQNGYFTGLMTEQYHSNPYYDAGTPVTYSSTTISLVSAWLWMDEGDTNRHTILFSDNTTSPVQLHDSPSAYFTSNGTAELANSHGLVTGLRPSAFPSATPGSATGYSNHQASVSIQIQSRESSTVRFLNMTIAANFTRYQISSSAPFTFQPTAGTYSVTVNLPPTVLIGNYTLTVHVYSWQYLEPQANEWIQLSPTMFNETLRVTSSPPPPPPTPPSTNGPKIPGQGIQGPSPSIVQAAPSLLSQLWTARMTIIPAIVLYLAIMSLVVVMIIERDRNRRKAIGIGSTYCPTCGNPVVYASSSCPICGTSLNTSPGKEQQVINRQTDLPEDAPSA